MLNPKSFVVDDRNSTIEFLVLKVTGNCLTCETEKSNVIMKSLASWGEPAKRIPMVELTNGKEDKI